MHVTTATIEDPCSGVCQIGPQGWCMGCCRRRDEIRDWHTMADAERRHLLDVVLPARGWQPVAHAH